MRRVHIAASESYDVLIDRGLLPRVGEESAQLMKPGKAVIVSEEKIFALYGAVLEQSLQQAGFTVFRFFHNGGEASKCLAVYGELQRFLCAHHFSRSDVIFALGGGVTGDLAGFAAATYQRGIAFVQIPTTLLAAVDSSVGGKTAVNLPEAKNQVGCFYQPKAVFCDMNTLQTLSEAEYRCGCAEVIKYGVLGDGAFFSMLEKTHIRQQEENVIARCVEMKRDIVQEDEFDTGKRRLLNLGHTIGHGVEQCSGYGITHGDAVAIGMAAVMQGAARRGICAKEDYARLAAVLQMYGLPTTCDYPAEALFDACMADKKIGGGKLHLVVPRAIGDCAILPLELNELRGWLT
ncbi:MAG: 3-dehydroquinate synthase [Eubacteriales bacterium]|nr:3-dehydroquinate synthase [Eubacteriales bacterium]